MMSSAPVTPPAAASAAVTPASAARPACMGLDMESERKACCRPAEKVATVASARAKLFASRPSSSAAADLIRERMLEESRGRNHRPRKERRVPVDDDSLRLVQYLRRDRLTAIPLGEPGELLDDVHPSPPRARCGARSR